MGESRPPRRKHRRKGPLPPLPEPSHIMWPDASSGYEAHPWSPAGAMQLQGLVASKITRRQRTFIRITLGGIVLASLIVTLVTLLLS